jgi:magnesium transporter
VSQVEVAPLDTEELAARLSELIGEGEWAKARLLLAALHPADQAEAAADLDAGQFAAFLLTLSAAEAGRVVEYLDEPERMHVISEIEPRRLGPVLDQVEDDVAVDILHELDPQTAAQALAAMHTSYRITPLLQYEDSSAGGIMTRGFISVRADMTAQEVLEYLRILRPSSEKTYYVFALDNAGRLLGVVNLRDLVVAPPLTAVEDLLNPDVVSVPAGTDREESARLLAKYDLLALPVVDDDARLLGVITVDDLMDVAEEEATEDMFRMVGVAESERIELAVPESVRRRLPWLFINLVTAFAAAAVVSVFEGTIADAAVLAVFMPVIAGMGGNSGIQTLTIIVRGVALGDIEPRDAFAVLRKEGLVSLLNGLALAATVAAVSYVWEGNFWLTLVVGIAMLANIAVAGIFGALIPITLRRVGADPALGSGIFVTMATDLMGFLIFLGLATIFISHIR